VVEVVVRGESIAQTRTAGVGDVLELVPGESMTIDGLTYAAQLKVVNDWTVPWLYLMFALGILGVGAAVFVPSRSVSIAMVKVSDPLLRAGSRAAFALHVRYTHRRNDPAFPRLLEEALTRAVADDSATQREEPA